MNNVQYSIIFAAIRMLFGLTSRRFASRVFFDLSVNGKAGKLAFIFTNEKLL